MRKAHAPKMPRNPLSAENTAAHEHANVSCGRQQRHGTKEQSNGQRCYNKNAQPAG
jgi:hypothetical protein